MFFVSSGAKLFAYKDNGAAKIKFTENKGQWDKKVLYKAQLDGGALYLEKNAFTYHFYDKETLRKSHVSNSNKISPINTSAFKVNFVNASPTVVNALHSYSNFDNYFIGNDHSEWASKVRHYKEIHYKEIYSNIQLEIQGLDNSIKYNFIVGRQGDPKKIIMDYQGVKEISIEKNSLKITTSINEIIEQEPYAYQVIEGKKVNVPCSFQLVDKRVSFIFDKGYDPTNELIIDPVLIFASYSGSTADNFGMTATYDNKGNLYSGGTAFDIGYPTTIGAYDSTYNGIVADGRTDVVISKYDSSGAKLIYSTYIGGATSTEIVSSLIVNSNNELMLYGATGSSDFPVTVNAYDTTFNGGTALSFPLNGTLYGNGTDIYVSRFSADGTNLLASTFIGGSQNDGINDSPALTFNYGDYYRGEITIDNLGNCYIASCTYSSDFPFTTGVFQPIHKGGLEGCIFKMNENLSTLLWSSFLGGAGDEGAYALTLDDSAIVYVTGGTNSADFPSTTGVYDSTFNGGRADGYIARISKDGSSILKSTFLGTDKYDQSYFVQLDKNGNIYVLGQTLGAFPVTPGVYSNPNSGQFINMFSNSLDVLSWGTVFGNGNGVNISPSAFLVDDCENIYVSGWGGNIITEVRTFNMPITSDAFQKTTDGFNFYLILLSKNATSLIYATYFGGDQSQEHVDGGTSRFDKKGIVYQSVCAGCRGNNDFPTTPGAWSRTNNSDNCNNGVFKFNFDFKIAVSEFTVNYIGGCAPLTVTFEKNNSPSARFLWDFGKGDTTSTVRNPTREFTNPGTYLVKLKATDSLSCNVSDSTYKYVTVKEPVKSDFDFSIFQCSTKVNFYDSSKVTNDSVSTWIWDFGDSLTAFTKDPVHSFAHEGTYDVKLISGTSYGCTDTVTVQVEMKNKVVSVNKDTNICIGNPALLKASGGINYIWLPSESLNNNSIDNPVAKPGVTTTYTVFVTTVNSYSDTCISNLTTVVNVFFPTFTATASSDRDTILKGESTKVHVLPNTKYSFLWNPSNSLNTATMANVIATPEKTTTYDVTVFDTIGCSNKTFLTIYVVPATCDENDIFVPNTFTPNADGNNDLLFARTNVTKDFYFAIYNRWGEMIFDTKNKNIGWDGTYKGVKVDPGVFAYYLNTVCYNGQVLIKKGNVTLIR